MVVHGDISVTISRQCLTSWCQSGLAKDANCHAINGKKSNAKYLNGKILVNYPVS